MILCLLVLLCFIGIGSAAIIFEDNFDNSTTYQNTIWQDGCSAASCINDEIDNWDYWRVDEMWHPITHSNLSYKYTLNIDDQNYRGADGKGFTVWHESNGGNSGDGWGSDGIIAKDLGANYSELHVRVYLKMQNDWEWHYSSSNSATLKAVRMSHWDGETAGSPFQFGTAGKSAPIYFFDFSQGYYGWKHFHSFRCDPQATCYTCNPPIYDESQTYDGTPAYNESLGDGGWHMLEYYIKTNSAIGTANGVLKYSVDGVVEYNKTDVEWIRSGGDINATWNMAMLSGNGINIWDFDWENNTLEQWYAFDDVVVSTDWIGPTECPDCVNISTIGQCWCGTPANDTYNGSTYSTGYCNNGVWQADECLFSSNRLKSYFNNTLSIQNVVNLTGYHSWDRSITINDNECNFRIEVNI